MDMRRGVALPSLCAEGSPYGDHICPLEDPGLLERGRLFCPGLTPIAPARRLAGVDGWAGAADTGGPAGRTVRMTAGHTAGLIMGRRYQQTRGGALARPGDYHVRRERRHQEHPCRADQQARDHPATAAVAAAPDLAQRDDPANHGRQHDAHDGQYQRGDREPADRTLRLGVGQGHASNRSAVCATGRRAQPPGLYCAKWAVPVPNSSRTSTRTRPTIAPLTPLSFIERAAAVYPRAHCR